MRSPFERRLPAALALLALALAAGCAPAAPRVERAWVRAADSAGTTVAYFTLVNGGPETLRVTGIGGDLADSIRMHETLHDRGMASMRELDVVEVAPGERLPFAPGGRHVMIQGLRRTLVPGTTVHLVLHVKAGPDLPVAASVRP